ncbi:MAG: hypothetical protein ACLSHC_06775 [Bilophila wadsworthia]
MARQPVVSEAEADGPEQVGPQDHEKEREQAFPALQALPDVSDRRGKRGSSGEGAGFPLSATVRGWRCSRFGYRGAV